MSKKNEIGHIGFHHLQRLGSLLRLPHFVSFIPEDAVQGLADPALHRRQSKFVGSWAHLSI
ncbi:MAG: hypothetical protein MZU91_11900 [Desulfosudis oleivorans]|nr:hypothetical protein [Desulfosudis oleivorans]